ncbi:inorganic phosphate transporter [Paracoccus sp. (in: a-proteobacteria)]|uniref:inorganic phosphate transporter n=1 Tax=Paracoccus sp. TaxID=267 RepID=UPI0032201D7D
MPALIQAATSQVLPPRRPSRGLAGRLALSAGFLLAAAAHAATGAGDLAPALALAAGFGGYMALNIGANDVANNIGPVVGARALPVTAALVMAALCEIAGALIAGGEVVGTIRSGIIAPALLPSAQAYVQTMLAALLAAAIWLNLATAMRAPVSTTHAIVGGVLGAGMAAAGPAVVDWRVMADIAASWLISPLVGAALAAALLYAVKRAITWQPDMIAAARRGVPVLAAAMAWVLTGYLLLEGLSRVVAVTLPGAMLGGLAVAAPVWALMRVRVRRLAMGHAHGKAAVNRLLAVPLILAAGALSFAHGSNDVANAIGPLAGIVDALSSGAYHDAAAVPFWVMLLGALGLAIGLLAFGPRVIRTVGEGLTDLDALRAWCIAMASTLTVIVASHLGMPISTTHVTVGAVLGVGWLREALKARHAATLAEIRARHPAADGAAAERFIARLHALAPARRRAMLAALRAQTAAPARGPGARRQQLVNRRLMLRILAAWVITVPAAAGLAALVFLALRALLLP